MSINPRHPSVLEKSINESNWRSVIGSGCHSAWLLRKDNYDSMDILAVNLMNDIGELSYVVNGDTLHCYLTTWNKVNALWIIGHFPSFRIKVASSPCDMCKLYKLGKVQRGSYPGTSVTSEDTVPEWFNEYF